MDFIISQKGSTPKTGIVIRRFGMYINRVKSEDALEQFLLLNLPSGTFIKTGGSTLELTDKVSSSDCARDEEGKVIPLDSLAEGLGYTFSRE